MNNVLITIVTSFLKAQLLLVPIMVFYAACHLKKINPHFLWGVHRISAFLFITIPIILLMTFVFGSVKTSPRVSSGLDLPRKWIPDEVSEAMVENVVTEKNIIQKQPAESVNSEKHTVTLFAESIVLSTENRDSLSPGVEKKSGWDYRNLLYLIPLVTFCLFSVLFIKLVIQGFKERQLKEKSVKEYFKGYSVYICGDIHSPFSTGIFSKKIYIPWSCNSLNKREPVLDHEYAHMEGNHNFWSLLESIIISLYWYNPFCYFFRKNGERLKELLADEYAGQFTDRFDYSKILIDEIEELNRKDHIYIAAGFNKNSIMKERIMNLMNPVKRKPSGLIKLSGILSIALCIVLTVLAGCSDAEKIMDPDDFSYVNISTLKEMSNEFDLVLSEDSDGQFVLDNTALFVGQNKELILPVRSEQLAFNYYNSSGQIMKTIPLDVESGEIVSYTTDSQGRLVVLSYDNENQTGQLERFADDGTLQVIMKLNGLELKPEALIKIDEKDRLYLRNDYKLYVYVNGKEVEIEEDRIILSMTITPGGKLYYLVAREPELINSIDTETYEISSIETSCENSVVSSSDEGLLVMDAKGIKEYKDDIFNGYITCSEDYPELIGLFNADFVKIDRNIYLIARDINTSELYIYRLQITDEPRLPDERPPLTIQVPDHLYQSMEYAARYYNKIQKNVQIEVSQYEDYDDNYEAYQRKLSTEILSGKGPDILYMSDLPWNDFIENGVLADMNDFIGKDSSFNSSDYLPALTAIEQDSGLYGFALNIYGDNILFAVKKSVMEKYGYSGTYNDISWEKLIEIAEAERRTDPNGMNIFPFGIPDFEENREHFISKILSGNNSFLDPETGSFAEQDFRSFLMVIDKLLNEDLIKPELSGVAAQYRSMEEGSTVFLKKDIKNFWVDMVEKKHLFNDETFMIVHPNFGIEDLFFSTTLLGINNGSEHKEAAWDFLKTILSEEFQDKMFTYAIPVNKALLEKRTLFSLKEPEQLSSCFADDTGYIEYLGASNYSDEELNGYFRNVERFRKVSAGVSALDGVITEQLQPYLDGDLSLDEVMPIIRDRVNTYINE